MNAPEELLYWPDLSPYGITLGVVEVGNHTRKLVLVDETGRHAHVARNMGFQRTRWDGLWVREDTRVVAGLFRGAFPRVQIRRLSLAQISAEAMLKVRARTHAAVPSAPSVSPGQSAGLSTPVPTSLPEAAPGATAGGASAGGAVSGGSTPDHTIPPEAIPEAASPEGATPEPGSIANAAAQPAALSPAQAPAAAPEASQIPVALPAAPAALIAPANAPVADTVSTPQGTVAPDGAETVADSTAPIEPEAQASSPESVPQALDHKPRDGERVEPVHSESRSEPIADVSDPNAPPAAGPAKPVARPAAQPPEESAAGVAVDLTEDLTPLMQEATPLGFNMVGEEVYATPSGSRFARFGSGPEARVIREGELIEEASSATSARFLRAPDAMALSLCAEGFVRQMAAGAVARVDDLSRFFGAVTGRQFSAEDPELDALVEAIDLARAVRLAATSELPDLEAFETALRLHENCQYYHAVSGRRMTPLPVGVVLQHIVSALPEGARVATLNAHTGEFSRLLDDIMVQAGPEETADAILGVFQPGELPAPVELNGVQLARRDHAELLGAAARLPKDGLGVFVLGGDGSPGRIGPSSRRFLDALASEFSIEGIVDLDGALTGRPAEPPQRIIVVGARREVPGHAGLPAAVPYILDYASLWDWGSKVTQHLRKPGSVSYTERGGVAKDIGHDQNVWQVPYIPSSLLSDPALMVPRNLAAPTRRAMLEVEKAHGPVDAFLRAELRYSEEDLKAAASAEQADAAAMGIHRLQSGLAFMEEDQTGIGKGRVLAMLARYARQNGIPVVFLTERADLFTDFYRDIEDIGAQDLFRNIFVVNDGAVVTSTKTGEVVARSAPRSEVLRTLRSLNMPQADILFATYSQFNRDPGTFVRRQLRRLERDAQLLPQGQSGAQATDPLAEVDKEAMRKVFGSIGLKLKDDSLQRVDSATEVLDPQLLAQLPAAALKSLWIGRAIDGALLILDESHNASGELSQTNANLDHAVMRAWNVVYSSATFARGAKNMRIYRRLFPPSVDVEQVHHTLQKGGEPLQEALSAMLAEDGALIRREHDLSSVKFEPSLDTAHLQENRALADKFAEVLAALTYMSQESRALGEALSENLKRALMAVDERVDIDAVGVTETSTIGSRLYLLVRQFLTLLNARHAAEYSVQALREGRKPVVVIDHTLEAMLNQAIEAEGEHARVDPDGTLIMRRPGFKDVLLRTMEKMLKVKLDGKDLDLKSSPEVAHAIRAVEETIRAFPDLPISPIDTIRAAIEAAGFSCAELSGRKRRLLEAGGDLGAVVAISTKQKKSARDLFNSGAADAIVLTGAGNSGISLHASERFLDRRQRQLIECEISDDVIKRLQYFGRVHRNGQVCAPIISTLSAGLPAENRVLSMQNMKLRRLSANITSNRDNAAITEDIPDLLNSVGNEVALRFLERNPGLARKLDIEMDKFADDLAEMAFGMDTKYVSTLFQRLVILPVAQQEQVIEEVTAEFKALVAELDEKGENPLKPRVYDLKARVIDEQVVEQRANADAPSQGRSAFDEPVRVSELEYNMFVDPKPAAEVKRDIKEGTERLKETLAKRFGQPYAKHAPLEFLAEKLAEAKLAHLERALPQEFALVADAVSSTEANVVKTMDARIDFLIKVLPDLKPGAAFKADYFDGDVQLGVIVGLVIPKPEFAHLPGQYEITFNTPGNRNMRYKTLHALFNDPKFELLGEATKAHFRQFDDTRGGSFPRRRHVMAGNLFRACAIAMESGCGKPAVYTDEAGQAQRAVVLPLGWTPGAFQRLPLRLHDPKLVVEFLNTEHKEAVSLLSMPGDADDTTRPKGLVLMKLKDQLFVVTPGTKHWALWLKNHPDLLKVTGAFVGDRTRLLAQVPLSMAPELTDALYQAGLSLYAKGGRNSIRVWFEERLGASLESSTEEAAPKDPLAQLGKSRRRAAATV